MRRSRSRNGTASRRGVTATVGREAGRIVSLRLSGHAGYAAAGSDIVCAGASALLLAAAAGVVEHCKAKALVEDSPGGDYAVEVERGGNALAQAVLETAVSGLRAIARTYPAHLRVVTTAGIRGPASKSKRQKFVGRL